MVIYIKNNFSIKIFNTKPINNNINHFTYTYLHIT